MLEPVRSRDEAHAAAVRLRSAAPIAAFAFPVVALVIAAALSGFEGDGPALWFVAMAAPTVVVAALAASGPPSTAIVVLAIVASAPLWVMLGNGLARSAPVATT